MNEIERATELLRDAYRELFPHRPAERMAFSDADLALAVLVVRRTRPVRPTADPE